MDIQKSLQNTSEPPSSSTPSGAMEKLFEHTITGADRKVITEYLKDAENDLKRFDAELSKLKMAAIALEAKRSRLKRTMEEYRSLLAPIHRMPPEILSTIFGLCCDENALKPARITPVMTLSVVCNRFRRLCLSTSSLWSSIAIRFGDWYQGYDRLNKGTRLFLRYSQQSPLDLSLDFRSVMELTPSLCNVIAALVKSSPFWRTIKLLITPQLLDLGIFQPIQGCMPKLEVLELSRYFDEDEELDVGIFGSCPALHTIRMYRGPAWEGLVLPYEQVNKGKLEFLFVHDALKYLSKCRRLERLELINVGGVNENAEEPPPLNSGIRFLSVRASDQVNLTSIFEYTTLPQLCTIDISGKNGYPSTHWPTCDLTPIHECLLRSSCTITTFHLKWLPTSDEQVLSLLRIMPALEVLQIDEIPFQYSPMAFEPEVYKYNNRIVTPTFLTHLAVMDRDSRIRSSFLPRLKELSLCIRAEEAIDSEALLHVITTRGLHHRDVGVSALTSFELTVMANGEPHASFGPVREVIETFRSVGQLRAKMLVIQV